MLDKPRQIGNNRDSKKMVSLLKSLLAAGLCIQIRVTGKSMRPLLRENDIVSVQPFHGLDAIHIGEIILISDHGKLILHRLIRKKQVGKDWLVQTKGDACNAPDKWLHSATLLGSLKSIKPAFAEPNQKTSPYSAASIFFHIGYTCLAFLSLPPRLRPLERLFYRILTKIYHKTHDS